MSPTAPPGPRALARWTLIGATAVLPFLAVLFLFLGFGSVLGGPGAGPPPPRWVLYCLFGYPIAGLAGVVAGLMAYNWGAHGLAFVLAAAPVLAVLGGLVGFLGWLVA